MGRMRRSGLRRREVGLIVVEGRERGRGRMLRKLGAVFRRGLSFWKCRVETGESFAWE